MSTIDRDLNNGLPVFWLDAIPPGGYVCGVPEPNRIDGVCGVPVESEPCFVHAGPPVEPDERGPEHDYCGDGIDEEFEHCAVCKAARSQAREATQ